MKKSLLLFFTCLGLSSIAQTITSITVTPANPSSSDTLTFIIRNDFSSGSCDGYAVFSGSHNNEIWANGYHCMGMLTVLCTDYDTVIVPPLAGGTYSFIFTLSTGSDPGCTPGTIANDVDSIQFTVSDATGKGDMTHDLPVQFFNHSDGHVVIKNNSQEKLSVQFFAMNGRRIIAETMLSGENLYHKFKPGLYLVSCEGMGKRVIKKMVVTN